MKKIAVILTNTEHYGDRNEKTGLWLAEATEFVHQVEQKGWAVDYISPEGGRVPLDPRSLKPFYVKKEDWRIWESEDFQNLALNDSKKVTAVQAEDYRAIYFTGGHGVLWDFPEDKHLQKLALAIYQKGGFVCSVCHGLAGLLNIRTAQGDFLIKDKRVTGFTNLEEWLAGKRNSVPFLTQSEAGKRGAKFKQKFPFRKHALRDGQLITGQNPMSGGAVAKLLLEALEEK